MSTEHVDVVVVGAGISGIGAGYHLQSKCPDRSYVIRSGKVLGHGRPHEVLQNAEAKKYYFGDSMDIGNGLRMPDEGPVAA